MKSFLYVSVLLTPLVLTGCNTSFSPPKPEYYTPPVVDSEIAKIRLIGAPISYAIYSINSSGHKTGGWVEKRELSYLFTDGPTRDIGLPKVTGKVYEEKYFETYLKPDTVILIYNSTDLCVVKTILVPEKQKIYEARISYTDKTGYCVLYLKEIVYDKHNDIYIERSIAK
ncbi:hypothetical protein [Klebsiella sp. BIGb0407]|uniref:hypothetical protein n=1 Tax=Klebsiella sp. BIGb0407 TaxID=2940603 RepID=UPI00216A0C3C|nr:hypothetical protein [Klebsiella sp. BIGb0407]MCS3430457.1 hypothetical protein [Klebsiella sp. BIGb0407]